MRTVAFRIGNFSFGTSSPYDDTVIPIAKVHLYEFDVIVSIDGAAAVIVDFWLLPYVS